MEMEDEKNVETDSADGDDLTEDENLSEEQYEITVGDIDSGDYSGTVNENQIINNVLSQIYSNSIIVFHDSSQITVNSINKLLSLNQQYDVAAM